MKEKGYTAEGLCVSRAYVSGSYGKYPADCHIMWSAIILVFGNCCLFAVNVEFLRIRGFLFTKMYEKGNEKNEKND